MKFRVKNLSFLIIIFVFLFLVFNFVWASTIDELNRQIQEKKNYIEELEKQKEKYEKEIEAKQGEILNLNNAVNVLNNKIGKTKIKIKLIETQIEQKNKEIAKIEIEISQKEKEIESQKEKLAEAIRLIYQNSNKNHLEIILTSNSLSDFFNQWQYEEKLQKILQKNVSKLKIVKQGLEVQKSDFENKKKKLMALNDELKEEREKYEEEEHLKSALLKDTRGVEKKFQGLLSELRAEYNQVNLEISSLEKDARKKLAEQNRRGMGFGGNAEFSWPIPSQTITCKFHDPEYPFRSWIGEHSGIDIRASQGTPVIAAASGYVARAKDAGRGYSYVMIIHNNEISTIYGHLSQIDVQEDTYVTAGQVIALSGGLPGTRGAGRFSLGPHLHFEVRVNGIPVNPEDYLP